MKGVLNYPNTKEEDTESACIEFKESTYIKGLAPSPDPVGFAKIRGGT